MASRIVTAAIPKTTETEIENYERVCREAGAVYRGVQPAFALRDGSIHPALILFDGLNRSTLALREPEFSAEAVRKSVLESNRSFKKVWIDYQDMRGYRV